MSKVPRPHQQRTDRRASAGQRGKHALLSSQELNRWWPFMPVLALHCCHLARQDRHAFGASCCFQHHAKAAMALHCPVTKQFYASYTAELMTTHPSI